MPDIDWMSLIGDGLNAFGKSGVVQNMGGAGINNGSDLATSLATDGVAAGLNMIAPGVGTLYKGVNSAMSALGLNWSPMSESTANVAGVSKTGRVLNNVAQVLSGPFSSIFAKKQEGINASDTAMNLGGYDATQSDINALNESKGSKNLFFNKKINNAVQDNQLKANQLHQIGVDSNRRISSVDINAENEASKYYQKLNGLAKNGAKLPSKEWLKSIYDLRKSNIESFKKGGDGRSIDELIEYAKKQNPRFIQRLSEPPATIEFIDDEGNKTVGSHYLESTGEYVIPRIQEVDGKLQFLSHVDAVKNAIKNNNFLKMSPEESIVFAKEYKQGWPEFFGYFKEGGKIGIDTSVIPEGALHAHKNNLESVDEIFEEVTPKGIPVVLAEEGGEIQQVAEIEKEEIIFSINITNELEKLWKDGSEESMIKAGKLIATEIMENTTDNTEELINGESENKDSK